MVSCYRTSLELAVEYGIRKIAFPSISTGVYNYPIDQAAALAVSAVKEFVCEHPGVFDLILWSLFDARTEQAYKKYL